MGSPNGDIDSDDDFNDEFLALGLVTMQSPNSSDEESPEVASDPYGFPVESPIKTKPVGSPAKAPTASVS